MKTIRIKSVKTEKVGPFKELDIQFNRKVNPEKAEVHIFTGENGTGKTTLLFLLTVYANAGFVARRFCKPDQENIVELLFEKMPEDILERFTYVLLPGNQGWRGLVPENSSLEDYFAFLPGALTSTNQQVIDFAAFAYTGHRNLKNDNITGIAEIKEDPLHNALNFIAPVDSKKINQWIANNKSKYAIAFSKNDTAARRYEESIKKLERVITEITDIAVEFELETDPLNVSIRVNNRSLDFDLLPDGLKSIISWIGDLLMRMDRLKWKGDTEVFQRNFMLFLDEIEVHLHPAWQRKILPVIQKAFPNAQIFISTHSPFVVGSVDGAWIYKFKKEGQYSVLDGEPVLSEDSNSFQYILEDTFGIKEQFGVEIENKLTEFYQLKNSILKGESAFNNPRFQGLIDEFSTQSVEVQNIIGMELKQMKRILGINEAVV